MNLGNLLHAGRTPLMPLPLELQGQPPLRLLNLLRVLPGQRYVGLADWQGRAVLAKLFVGAKAARHFNRELRGVEQLAAQGLPSPALLAQGLTPGEGGWLLFDFLHNAHGLDEEWQALAREPLLGDAQQRLLGEALSVIAQMHRKGLWQQDLHLGNLLRQQQRLYLIDGGGIAAATPGQPLDRGKVLDNLARFFAQFPSAIDAFTEQLLVHYLRVNARHALPLDTLLKAISKARTARLEQFIGKLGRDCTAFQVTRGPCALQVLRRNEQALLASVLAEPDRAIGSGQSLKQGGTSTVARIDGTDRQLVIKRYNIKNVLHGLSRCWRPSRAWHSWREGNRLDFLGIATPKPLAVLERRCLYLRRQAYLVTEHACGTDIITRFASCGTAQLPPEAELRALDELFAALLRERISHGDLKGSNILWQEDRWLLIDLDAMRQHRSASRFAAAYAVDRARLLRNWPEHSALHRALDKRLPTIG
jgi:tRNA A-37 threonylcarbamoyl transferase component Bud32